MKPRHNPLHLFSAATALALASSAQAANITWDTPAAIAGDSDVFNVGSLQYGYTESAAGTTVNGVSFAAGNSTTDLGGGNVTMSGFDGGVDAGSYNDGRFSGEYATLIQGGAWNYGSAATVNLNNLSTSHVYATQFWVADYRQWPNTNYNRSETLTGGANTSGSLTYLQVVDGVGNDTNGGSYVIGRFTADATSQAITVTPNSGGSAQMNAIQVRDITGVWNGAVNTNLNSGTANFEGGSYTTISGLAAPVTSLHFADTDGFGNSMASKNSITVDAAGFSAGSLNFQNNSVNYTLQNASGTTGITGATVLNTSGSGTLTLASENTYTGGTTISNGVLQVGAGGTEGTLGSGDVTNNASLVFNRSNDVTVANTISGSGSLVKSGAGKLTLTGSNSYTGGTNVNQGTLKLDLGARSGNDALGTFAVANGATLNIDNTNTTVGDYYPQNVVLSGAGTVTKTGVGSIDFWNGSSLNSFTGTMDVQQGALRINNIGTNANMSQATLNIASGATFDVRYNASLSVDKLIGSGTLDQSYNGGSGLSVTVGSNNGSSTFGGVIQNSSGQPLSLTKAGSGTFTLASANTHSGATSLNGGTLRLENAAALGSGSLNMASGTTLQLRADSNATFSGGDNLGGLGGASITIDVNQLTSGNTDKTLSFATGGFNTYNTTINVTGGNGYTLALGGINEGYNGTLALNTNSGNLTIGNIGSASAVSSLSVGGDANTTITGAISSSGGLSKSGNGTLTLSGSSSYGGGTTVTAGKLIVNGDNSGATGAVTVASGATLGGSGTVGGATTIQSGGHLAVGNSPGTQTFSSNLDLQTGSIFDWDLAGNTNSGRGTNYDGVDVTGTLTIASDAVFRVIQNTGLDFNDTFWDTTRTWSNIFNVTGTLTSNWSNAAVSVYNTDNELQNVASYGSFTINGTSLTWTAVPEPTSALAGLLIAAGLLRRRREERGMLNVE